MYNIDSLVKEAEENLKEIFSKIDENAFINSKKVLNAFKNNNITESHFSSTTGYGYDDLGREAIESVFSEILDAQDSLVRNQFISGSHALTVTLFALLRPNDTLLSITGKPYDTLEEVIGIKDNSSSLKSYLVNYEQIDLVENDFNYELIKETLKKKKIKVIEIQRSCGYDNRQSIDIKILEKIIKFIRKIDKKVIIMIDNCYCEFVETTSPLSVGADIIVGSLIKNLGGGITPNGAYVAGNKDLIQLVSERLTVPGSGKEVGPTLGINKYILQGLYMAPNAVSSSLKTVLLASYILEKLNYDVSPKYDELRTDIVQKIIFKNEEKLIKFVQSIQSKSAINSNIMPIPWDMPGYDDKVIMASGSFIQGSSIEISCDGPVKDPYIAYLQGGITYEYGKIAIIEAISNIINK
ncbi:MAG: methionine gamma-lyase family protein [Mycoplasmatota bacterium]